MITFLKFVKIDTYGKPLQYSQLPLLPMKTLISKQLIFSIPAHSHYDTFANTPFPNWNVLALPSDFQVPLNLQRPAYFLYLF